MKRHLRLPKLTSLTILGFLILSSGPRVNAGLANYKLCFPDVISTPDTWMQPPDVNGVITGDNGWTSSFRYILDNGTTAPDVIVQGIKDSSFIYLSFEVRDDPNFDDQDMIIIAFDPDGTAANQRRLHIFPVFTTGAQASGDPRDVQYWQNSTTWNTVAAGAPPAGTLIKVTSAGAGPVAWFVEMKLPRAGFGLPAAGDFGFYFNVMRFNNTMTADEKHWPPLPDSPDIFIDPTDTPAASLWGNAALSGACNGVSIDSSDITTNQTPPAKIALDAPNFFNVLVHNNSTDGSGVSIAATQIKATFKIANFGLPGPWDPVPATGNPTGFTNTVPAASTSTITVGPWSLTLAEQATYAAANAGHQCVLVELDSNTTATTFVKKSAWTNMDFGPASKFEHIAEISGRGYEPPPGGGAAYDFDLFVTTQEGRAPANTRVISAAASNQTVHQFVWIARGFRRTGRYIDSLGKRFEVVHGVGAFGYVVQHAGELKGWNHELTGDGLEKVANNLYRIKVPQNGAAIVKTIIEAVEPGGTTQPPGGFKHWGLSLHAGASIPHGTFNTFYNPGPNAGIDLEYRVNPNFSLEGIYTFHRFMGETIGLVTIGDLNVHQFSFNGKVYGSTSPWRPFFNFGAGAYKFDPGNTRPGLNVGFGVQRDITPTFAIDAMYNFHNVFTSGSSTRFSTVQGGVRFRF
jgi:hypothetical protein